MEMTSRLWAFYGALYRRYGPQGWWPGRDSFEVIVGAILTQNASWKNVEAAIGRLKERELTTPRRVMDAGVETVSECIRPVGYYRVKTERLFHFLTYFRERYDFDFDRMGKTPTRRLRDELLGVPGIGPETADSILLYALGRPEFVVDAYTQRVLCRHRLIDDRAGYTRIQELCTSALPRRRSLYNEYHALLVRVGKEHCRKSPICTGCPLLFDLSGKIPGETNPA
jgi:endonuclease-3 related protein